MEASSTWLLKSRFVARVLEGLDGRRDLSAAAKAGGNHVGGNGNLIGDAMARRL
jgi:hypothetical protein